VSAQDEQHTGDRVGVKHSCHGVGWADEWHFHIGLGPDKTAMLDCAVVQKIVCGAVFDFAGHGISIRKLTGLFAIQGV
jgi:hypothetical protein